MSFLALFFIGIGLSMDAFAAAVCQGLCISRMRYAIIIGLYFGGFQALMPSLGWLLGSQFADSIQRIDHWIAFILLLLIGGNMVREALLPEECGDVVSCTAGDGLDHKQLLLLAVATSIDALAVGVTFAFLDVPIIPAASIIGVTTCCLSIAGAAAGNFLGAKCRRRAELFGGILLILLGANILLEHLGGH